MAHYKTILFHKHLQFKLFCENAEQIYLERFEKNIRGDTSVDEWLIKLL